MRKEDDKDSLTKEEVKQIVAESLAEKYSWTTLVLIDRSREEIYSNTYKDKKLEQMSITESNVEAGEPEIVNFELETVDPYENRRLFKSKKLYFKANVINTLVGCNGSGKSTILYELDEILRRNGYPVIYYDNMKDGGTNGIDTYFNDNGIFEFLGMQQLSEGEQILTHTNKLTENIANILKGKIKRNEDLRLFRSDKSVFLLLDAIDSGYSIDNIVHLKTLLGELIWLADENNKNLYIISAANSYELVRNSKSWDVQNSKEISFKDYTEYAEFVIKTRKHILKQWEKRRK